MDDQATTAYRRGQAHSDRGRFDLAHRWLARALTLATPPADAGADTAAITTRVRILMSLATAEDEVGGDGSGHLRQARDLAAALDRPALEFAVLSAVALQ